MKKLQVLFISILSMSTFYGQDITDALRYSQSEIQGTARFRALSGAFGALGGDISAVSINPAGAAVFTQSHASFSLSNAEVDNDTRYFNGLGSTSESNFDIHQGGAVFVFASNNSSPWKKFTLGVAYDRTNNFDDNWFAFGTNPNSNNFNNTIASYFFDYADGLRFDEISAFDGETLAQAYQEIGSVYGFGNQQAFLGYESFILDPEFNTDDNTSYLINLGEGNFNHDYSVVSTGYNGKISFNVATQYEDNLYLGLNINSHFIDYQRSNLLFEENSNGSDVDFIEFENNLSTTGTGFSFQLGGILKLSPEFRVGLTYDSPTWFTIEEESTQYLGTDGINGFVEINPQVVNIFPEYKIKTPSKVTGSLAYIFGQKGLISFDYSTKDYSKTEFRPTSDPAFADENNFIGNTLTDAATYRFGGEYKHKQFSFRGGYRFEESPYANGLTVGDLTGYSLGLGYNFGNTKLDLTYDQSERSFETPLYSIGLIDTVSIDRTNSNITLSLSFNI